MSAEDFPIPPQDLALAMHEGKPTQVAAVERVRIHHEFTAAFDILFDANRDLVQTDSPHHISRFDKAVQENVQTEADSRKKTKKKLTTPEEVAKEKRFQDMPEGTDPEKDTKIKAINEEIARRKKLQEAVDVIYTVAYGEIMTSDQVVDQAVFAENKRRVGLTPEKEQAYITKYGTEHPDLVSGELENAVRKEYERLAAENTAKVMSQAQEAQFRESYIASYKDENGYHKIDENGVPVSDTVNYSDALATLDQEFKRIAGETTDGNPDGPATENANKMKPHIGQLHYVELGDQKGFAGKSEEDMAKEEMLQDYDLVAEACSQEIASLAEDMMGDLKGLDEKDNMFVVDENGKIKVVNLNPENLTKLQERLKDRKPDEKTLALYSLVQQLGAYLENRADPDRGWRIATVLYYNLQSTKPGKQLKLNFKNPDRLSTNMNKITREMVDQIFTGHFPQGAMHEIMEANPLRLLGLALACREKEMVINDARGVATFKDTKELKNIFANWKLTDADKQFVLHFASYENLIETALQRFFGLDPNTLQDAGIKEKYISQVLDYMAVRSVNDPKNTALIGEVKTVYREVLSDTLSDDTLEKIKKEHGFSGALKFISMLALILGPSIFKIFDEGAVTGQEQAPTG